MSDSDGIPGMQYTNPDGSPKSRLEMDQWMRKEMLRVFWLRIHAFRTFGLSKQIAYDMREICVRHWLLDEMIRRGFITGDLLGVNANTSNDEGELRQFTQRLTAMIQAGQAVQPQYAEGVDMNGYTPPPPPVPMGPPGAPAPGPAYPPGPPGPPQQQQYQPPGPPVQGYPPGPPAPPAGPPAAPQYAAPPPMGPPGYAPPPAGVPTAPPPMAAPPGPPAPMGPPAAPAPARRGGRKAAGESGPAVAPPPPAGPPMGPPGAPQGFAPAGFAPPAPQGYAPPPAAPMMQAPQAPAPTAAAEIDLTPLLQRLDALAAQNAAQQQQNTALTKKVELLSMITTIVCRAIYQKQGSPDAAGFLTELGISLPQ